jgi:hypothetical protein
VFEVLVGANTLVAGSAVSSSPLQKQKVNIVTSTRTSICTKRKQAKEQKFDLRADNGVIVGAKACLFFGRSFPRRSFNGFGGAGVLHLITLPLAPRIRSGRRRMLGL